MRYKKRKESGKNIYKQKKNKIKQNMIPGKREVKELINESKKQRLGGSWWRIELRGEKTNR